METDKYQERRKLYDNLSLLVKSEQIEIFKILRKNDENYTENSNGIFFDILTVSDKTYRDMSSFMDFCLKTRQEDTMRTLAMTEMAAEIQKETPADLTASAVKA